MKSVLILSKYTIGNVELAAKELRARNLRTVLVSELPDDVNAAKCDGHVVFDWGSGNLPTLIASLDKAGIDPIAVVNMVESLISWHKAIAVHYGLPGGDAGRDVLASKALVRDRMRALGLSTMRFCDDPAAVDFFPAIVKPARESAASYLVGRVENPAELLAYQRHLAERGLVGLELVIEEYLPGTEFSVDGPVIDGRYHPVLICEKRDHDEARLHDGTGIQFHPPQRDHVRDGARVLGETISALCTDLRLDQLWLHVEGRVTEDGQTELIEINPRPGGTIMPLIHAASGINPIEAFISMALGEFKLDRPAPTRAEPILGMFLLETNVLGTVEFRTTADELRKLPGVIDVRMSDGYQITELEMENYFLKVAVAGDSVDELRASVAAIMEVLDYRIVAPA